MHARKEGPGTEGEGRGRQSKGRVGRRKCLEVLGERFRTEGGAEVVAVHLVRVRRGEKVAALGGTGCRNTQELAANHTIDSTELQATTG